MSMWLMYSKVSPDTLAQIKATPELLNAIFFDDGTAPSDWNSEKDGCELDYRTFSAIAEALFGIEIGEQDTWTAKATGLRYGDSIEFEFCYGHAFCFSPTEVKNIADGMAAEDWDPDDDFEENVARFFKIAAEEGKAVIGGVN